jgi:hypothetical protein
MRFLRIMAVLCVLIGVSCKHEESHKSVRKHVVQKKLIPVPIIDCHYTFDEAIAGTRAPQYIIDQLELIVVRYYSVDGKLHQGQILTNKRMAEKIKSMFEIMLKVRFPVAHAIPVVKYNWDDEQSMEDNNTYSFCYRNAGFSKHAKGLAIDINPFFNPVRWKGGYTYRKDKPVGAVYDPNVPGTFSVDSKMVHQFKELGLRWGHSFSMKYDDHHFELR